jgi:NAD(P)-dependent dehydrogenase (short-subunit alcohol dehydrogenase family)
MSTTALSIVGESAVVTGAGRGIGRRIAASLVEAGVDVAINDIDDDALAEAERELDGADGDVLTYAADASDPDAAEAFVAAAADAFGGIDIVVNNVGIAGPTKSCEDLTHEEFMSTLSVNLGSLFNTTSAAIPHLERGGGRVVNISSMSGKRPLADRTPYTTSKMGVIGFTRTLAVELADDGVNVNAICPGSVAGPRLDAVIEGQAAAQGRSVADVESEFRSAAPMDEFVTAEDVADAVLVLCSERTRRVTGQDLNVTGGVVMY